MLKVAGFTGVFATLGLQGGAVSLISGALGANRERWANALLRAFLLTRIYMAVALLLLGVLGSSRIASSLLRNPSAVPYVEWGCISGSTNAILMFSLHHLQARQAFAKYTMLTITTSLCKLVTIVLLMTAEVVTAYRVAALWALLPTGRSRTRPLPGPAPVPAPGPTHGGPPGPANTDPDWTMADAFLAYRSHLHQPGQPAGGEVPRPGRCRSVRGGH